MYKKLFSLAVISFFLISCGGAPSTSDDPSRPGQTTKAKDPRAARYEYALQLLERAKNQKQPIQNESYFEVIKMLFDHQPRGAEHRLIKEILGLMNKALLSSQQHSQYIVYSGRLYFSQEEFFQAQQVLEEEIVSTDTELLTWYHRLRARIFDMNRQVTEAIDEYTTLHALLLSNTEKTANLEAIWGVLGLLSLQELEKNIAENTYSPENQRLGWQQLAYLVKTSQNRFILNKKLSGWKENFPQHMADKEFIQQLIKQRFELLLQPKQIAILMPAHGKLVKPAQTIQNGILAAHFRQPLDNGIVIRFYDTSGTESIWPLYKKAIYDGAEVVIGPLTKKHLAELTATDDLPVPTLALNQVSDPQRTKNLYQFGLLPEDEAVQVARSARQDGHFHAAVIVPETNWGKRLKKSFSEQWQQLGGVIVEAQFYQSKTHDYSDPIKKLLNLDESLSRKQNLRQVLGKSFEFSPRRRQDVDMIFLAAFPKQARQIPLQISYYHGENIPVYATSHVISKAFDIKANKDLNGIHYTDMPWMLDSSLTAISRENQQVRASYQRLFALGVDTYLLLPYLHYLEKNSVEYFEGETGLLSVLQDGKINRITPMGVIKNGNSKITKSAKAILSPKSGSSF